MKTSVVHCKREKHDVYGGRPSKWGNPFVIGKDGSREQVMTDTGWWPAHGQSLYKPIQKV